MGEIPACQAKTYKSRSKVHQNCLKICTKFKIQAQKPLFSNRWFLWRLRFAGLYSDISLTRLHCRAVTWQTMQGREREERITRAVVSRWGVLVRSGQLKLIIGKYKSELAERKNICIQRNSRCQHKLDIWYEVHTHEANVCQGSRRIFWKLFSHFVIDGARPEPVIFYANANHQERKLYRIFTLLITIWTVQQNEEIFLTTRSVSRFIGSMRNWDLCFSKAKRIKRKKHVWLCFYVPVSFLGRWMFHGLNFRAKNRMKTLMAELGAKPAVPPTH